MFLSVFVSRYRDDGSLEVDLRDQQGPRVRYGSFAAGMPWHRWTADGWVETAFDWGARLLNRAHESRTDLPVLRYLQPWPRDLIGALYPVWHAQSAVMQICSRHPAARDLALSNLNLLWLVGARYAEDAHWHSELPEMLELTQRELLAAVLDVPQVRPAQVRLLRKILLTEGTDILLNHLRQLVANEEAVMALRHWPCLPSSLIPLASGPLLRHLHWLRERLASTSNRWLLGQILHGRVDLMLDTSRMLERYPRDTTDELVGWACRDWDGIQRLHDVLVDAGAADWSCDLDPRLSFGRPPIPSDDRFQAITTVAELIKEGKVMQHCVATRAQDIQAGLCYIYRVNVLGERGTLQVGIRTKHWVIDEIRLKRNADPSPATWATAREWLERAGRQRKTY
jgi:hypothetical protein